MDGKQVIEILKKHGWELKKVKGSHHHYTKDGVKVPVPVHAHRDLKISTLKDIERQTGVKLR